MKHLKLKRADLPKWKELIGNLEDCDDEHIIVTLDDEGGPISGGGTPPPIPPAAPAES